MLAARIPGCRFLDLFAGSGAVGLEAWSRGAGCVYWVESAAPVLKVLKQNIDACCGSADHVIGLDALRFLKKKGIVDCPFDIVFADPPYDKTVPAHGARHDQPGQGDGRVRRPWLGAILEALEESGLISARGLVVFEQGSKEDCVGYAGWRIVGDRVYGDSRLRLFLFGE